MIPQKVEIGQGFSCTFPTKLRVLETRPPQPKAEEIRSTLPAHTRKLLLDVNPGDVLNVEDRFSDNYWLASIDGRTGYVPLDDTVVRQRPSARRKEMIIGEKVIAIWQRMPKITEELCFEPGDVIHVLRRHNSWWYWGKVSNRVGLFPMTYVEPVPSGSSPAHPETIPDPTQERARALWAYEGTETRDLTLKKGDIIDLLSKFHEDWWLGLLNERVGIFPSNHVALDIKAPPVRKPRQPPFYPYYVRAQYDLASAAPNELNLVEGDLILVDNAYEDMWWSGRGPEGRIGWFPENYVRPALDRRAYED
ncbi:hypothetical protein FRC17_006961 [Serendipita sp. 399]|nr:hypothetical protein FRC17_006961 [Serendipita sp. 399]